MALFFGCAAAGLGALYCKRQFVKPAVVTKGGKDELVMPKEMLFKEPMGSKQEKNWTVGIVE